MTVPKLPPVPLPWRPLTEDEIWASDAIMGENGRRAGLLLLDLVALVRAVEEEIQVRFAPPDQSARIAALEAELAAAEQRAEDLSLRMEGAERWNAIHITEIAALKQRAEGLAKDAERYRWLRDEESHVEKVNIEWLTAPHGDALDAIIDAAIAGSCE